MTFGRNGFVLFSGGNWDDARPHLSRLWEQSGLARQAHWHDVEPVVHGAWLMSAAVFARARLKAEARQRIEHGLLMQRMARQAATAETAGLADDAGGAGATRY